MEFKKEFTKEQMEKSIEIIRKVFREDPELSAMVKKFEKKLGIEKYSDRL